MIKVNLFYSFILMVICSSFLYSQSEERMIHFSLNTIRNFNENEFHEYWKPLQGIGGELSFDHPVGELGAGFTLMRFDKQHFSAKSFYGVDYYFLYRHTTEMIGNLTFIAGFDFGIFEFRFDDDEEIRTEAERVEREFAFKLLSGLSYEFIDAWRAELKASYQHIYTRKKIELFYLNLGITKSFSTPGWLKEFFE